MKHSMKCVLWLLGYGVLSEWKAGSMVRAALFTVYTGALLYYVYSVGKLKYYRVTVPWRIPRGSVMLLVILCTVAAMNALFSNIGESRISVQTCGFILYTAFMEELFFRGYLIRELCRYRIWNTEWKRIVGSGILFGLMHGVNLVRGADVIYTIFQILCAVGIGILLGTLTVIFDSILPGTVMHCLINITASDSEQRSIWQYGILLLLLMIGVLLCYKKYSGGNKT